MNLGNNLQLLRKMNNLTQEELAEKLSVSRQTVSKWEMNQVYPEIPKLVEISNLFHCKVDQILTEDMQARQDVYSEVCIKEVEGFRMARYVMITPNPEDDVNAYMNNWAIKSGLRALVGKDAK